MSRFAIEFSGVSFSYDDKEILHDVSFKVPLGAYVSIIGRNGAGKSTLLKCAMRILKTRTGNVFINGTKLSDVPQRQLASQVAYVPQATGRHSPYSVLEHVMVSRYAYLKPFQGPGERDRKAVLKAIEKVGMTAFKDFPVNTLSGGERQKVYLASAFAQGAEILLLDEPTTFLDPKCAQEMLALLKYANQKEGKTIIAVTHDINGAAQVSSELLALRDGCVCYFETPEQFMSPEKLAHVFGTPFTVARYPSSNNLFAYVELDR